MDVAVCTTDCNPPIALPSLSIGQVLGGDFKEIVHGVEEWGIHTIGGDFVHPGALTGQHVHADGRGSGGWDERPKDADEEFCPWAVASIAVHDIDENMAPLLFYGWEAMYQHSESTPPESGDVLLSRSDAAVTMRRGDILIRNPKVWHAGSANLGNHVRYLPGMVFDCTKR